MSTNKILVATDLDGTLLKDNKKISLRTKLYFKKLQKQGNIVCFSTGRSPRTCMHYQKEIGLDGVMILLNGNLIINTKDKDFPEYKILWNKDLLKKVYKELLDLGYIEGAMCENDTTFFTNNEKFFSWTAHDGEARRFIEAPLEEAIDEDTYNFVITSFDNSKENQKRIKEYVESRYPEIDVDLWGNQERLFASFLHVGWNKKTAVDYVRKYYGIEADDCYVFGDSTNDLQMVTGFKNGYAMKNSFPQLLCHTSQVTKKDNNHNGIVFELKRLLKTRN